MMVLDKNNTIFSFPLCLSIIFVLNIQIPKPQKKTKYPEKKHIKRTPIYHNNKKNNKKLQKFSCHKRKSLDFEILVNKNKKTKKSCSFFMVHIEHVSMYVYLHECRYIRCVYFFGIYIQWFFIIREMDCKQLN